MMRMGKKVGIEFRLILKVWKFLQKLCVLSMKRKFNELYKDVII